MTEHHTSRLARAKKKDQNRSQALRDRKKAALAPTTHTVDRAIAHGFCAAMGPLSLQRLGDTNDIATKVSIQEVLEGAIHHLTDGTHGGNSYNIKEVIRAIEQRIERYRSKGTKGG
jgi:hypothetical protein